MLFFIFVQYVRGIVREQESLSPDSRWVWRSGARSATKAGASAPGEVRGTSGATDHDARSWFAPIDFSVCRERSIRFPFRVGPTVTIY